MQTAMAIKSQRGEIYRCLKTWAPPVSSLAHGSRAQQDTVPACSLSPSAQLLAETGWNWGPQGEGHVLPHSPPKNQHFSEGWLNSPTNGSSSTAAFLGAGLTVAPTNGQAGTVTNRWLFGGGAHCGANQWVSRTTKAPLLGLIFGGRGGNGTRLGPHAKCCIQPCSITGTCITDSHRCTAESNRTLQINYILIKCFKNYQIAKVSFIW